MVAQKAMKKWQIRPMSAGECPMPEQGGRGATSDALEDSDGRHAAEAVEDEGVRDVECADEKSGTGDDLPEGGTIGGHFHLE